VAARKSADPVLAYAKGVTSGKIVAGPHVRKACERHLRDLKRKGFEWRLDRAQLAIDFYAEMLVLEDGRPFKLQPWQAFIVGSCFGWYGPTGYRRFRTAYVETGKGSGKTPLAAGIGLYGLVADGEPAPQIYSAATDKDQAKICFKDAVRMVQASPELSELIRVQAPLTGGGSLTIADDNATFRPVSSEHKGLDGLRVHMGLIDELHEHRSATVADKIRAGTKQRRNALIFEITNSGWDRTSVCWAHHELSLKVLEGHEQNDSWFAYVCALDEGDEWTDEACWPKVNPSLGTVLPIEYLREQVRDAQGMPSKENIVKRLNFCVWTEQADRWLEMDTWDGCPSSPLSLDQFAGRQCMAGLDGASTNDLFAFVLLFGPDEEDFYDAVARFWIPKETLNAKDSGRSESDRLKLVEWAQRGFVTVTDGETTNYDVVESDILADLEQVQLRRLSFDRFGVTQLVTHLRDALGEDKVVDFPQTMAQMSAPSKELEKILRDGKLRHGGNPVLRWMASNVALLHGPNEQIKPDRRRSGEKIDGVIALIEALDGAMRLNGPGTTVYDGRGLLVI
jgi:phage terminase large subunit-like protein